MASNNKPSGLQSFDDFYGELGTARHSDFLARGLLASSVDSAAFEEKRQHLLRLYKDVSAVHSFVDDSGQIFDCIPREQQPALRKSRAQLASPPDLSGRVSTSAPNTAAALSAGRTDRHGNAMTCPAGTVPIRRVTLEEMNRFHDLHHFLRKGPRSDRSSVLQATARPDAPEAQPPHEYAHASQQVANLGGHSFVSIWSPTVSGDQIFSLSQHWYVANGSNGVQTAEVGWQVYPQKYGHSQPVLFTYWTADGYQSTGSYSTDAGDFVQYSATCPVGIALAQTSVSGGAQAEIELAFVLSGGNWWLFAYGTDAAHAVGYYPTSLYQNGPMATGAEVIDFGGETVGNGTYPPMGSGAFASAGNGKAAYQRNITYFPPGGGAQQASLAPSFQWPNAYTIDVETSQDWGEYFFFGGPGNSAPAVASVAPVFGKTIAAVVPAARPVPSQQPNPWWWLGLTVALVAALVGCALWIGGDAYRHDAGELRSQWLTVEFALLVAGVASGWLAKHRLDGIFIDDTNRIGLTRVQWIAWLVVLLGALFTETVWNIGIGWSDLVKGSFPDMQPELYALLGIVAGSTVVSGVIANTKMNAQNAPLPPAVPTIGVATNKGLMDANVDPSEASWADLYLGDEVATRDVVDVSRLQKLIITILLVMTYVQLIWAALHLVPDKSGHVAAGTHFASMPLIGDSFVWLLGISHAAYLAYKATPKGTGK